MFVSINEKESQLMKYSIIVKKLVMAKSKILCAVYPHRQSNDASNDNWFTYCSNSNLKSGM